MRDYVRLFEAMNAALVALTRECDPAEVLRRSFDAVAAGFHAENALLLLLESGAPVPLRCIHALGTLSPRQIRACERGESVRGVSPSVIQAAITARNPLLIEDPRLHAEASCTSSLTGDDFSVLCAPVCDPLQDAVLAVVYLQNTTLTGAYEEVDRLWLEGYALAAGRAFALHFARQRRQHELEASLRGAAGAPPPELIGESSSMRALLREIHDVHAPALAGQNPEPILILGERGSGKDLIARYLHAYSARSDRPFVAVNCAEIQDELAAVRFFGCRRGAYTGAVSDEPGLFRAAHRGVLLLDEIADLSPRAQAVLLRALENRTIVAVGDTREVQVDVAVILATNRDLDEAVAQGLLRPDFYDRFRMHVIRLPALRERPADVPPLCEHFRQQSERRLRKRTLGFTPEAMGILVDSTWRGNVRELSRVCALLVTYAPPGTLLDRELLARCCPDLAGGRGEHARSWAGEPSFREGVRAFVRELIASRIEKYGGDVRRTRESLGMTKTTYHRYLRMLKLGGGAPVPTQAERPEAKKSRRGHAEPFLEI